MAKLAKYEIKGLNDSLCKKMSDTVYSSNKFFFKFPTLIEKEIARLHALRDAAISAAVWTNSGDTVIAGIRSHHSNCLFDLQTVLLQSKLINNLELSDYDFPEKY